MKALIYFKISQGKFIWVSLDKGIVIAIAVTE